MKDGKEGTGYTASNEKVTGLNETIIQSKKWSEQAATDGVTKTAKNLFNNTGDNPQVTDPIYVIPTGDNMNVTIVYDIETKDDKLAGTVSDGVTPGVSIENKISKTITITGGDAMKLEAGKKYTIQLHLGLSQVEFDAKVDEWDDAAAAAGEAWLPGNGAGDVYTTGITLDQTSLSMTIGGEDVTLTATVTPDNATDKTVSWTSSDPAVASVDANGKVHAVGAGTAIITATTSGGQTCDVTVTVPNLSTATSADAGKWVDADGNILNSATGAAGWIAYATDDHHGLILAMEDGAIYKTWDEALTVDFNGLPSIALTIDDWKLPSKTDWENMDAGIDANAASCPLRHNCGYWSSTVDDTGGAWSYTFGVTNGALGNRNKSSNLDVRAVLAF